MNALLDAVSVEVRPGYQLPLEFEISETSRLRLELQ